ncbi:MAG: Allantoicase [Thelocarpon impressellum]|nr:MAG: Allantoicase [Thelocarpon impressellum]
MDTQALAPETIQDVAPPDSIRSAHLASARLSSRVIHTTDDFFAPAASLLSPLPPVQRANTYVATGAWYDGWESRRHNASPPDTATIALGVASGRVLGFEVDTGFFAGNHAERAGVLGLTADSDASALAAAEGAWEVLLPPQPCGPSARHAWLLPQLTPRSYTHLRLQMFPDGGIARFRAYGRAVAVLPEDAATEIDLAAATNGGRVVTCSNERFGKASNLLLPGRGEDMGDGWETARSRGAGHVDWAIVRLGVGGNIARVVVDTAFFRGNFPQSVVVYGAAHAGEGEPGADAEWSELVGKAPCQADHEHVFADLGARGKGVTHVKLVMVPDGGVKRLRVFGTREPGKGATT